MELKLTITNSSPVHFTKCQLQELASSICVSIPDRMRLVYYGQTAPMDTTLSWQPTNGADDPVGKVKTFSEGTWNE